MSSYTVQAKDGNYYLDVGDYRLKADHTRLDHGNTRCALGIEKNGAVVLQEDARLGTSKGRARIIDLLGTHGQTITAECLLALEKYIRERLIAQPKTSGKIIQFSTTPTTPVKLKTLDEVHTVFRQWLYLPDTAVVDLAIATIVANHNTADPVWLLIVDAPGGGKTEVINSLGGLPHIHRMADFTEGGLLSGTSEKERTETATGGLLREIGDFGILTISDFGTILAMQQDVRGKILQYLREMYDGHCKRNVGTDGGQTLEWYGKVGLVGGATPAIDAHHSVLASLGERFIFYRPLPSEETKREMARQALKDIGKELQMRAELRQVVTDLFASLDLKQPLPDLQPDQEEYLINLCTLTVHCRSAVERDRIRREVQEVPEGEYGTRLVKVLRLLHHGLTIIGVDSDRAWTLVKQVALSSMPRSRRRVLEYLVKQTGKLSTAHIATELDHPTTSVKRALEDLTAHTVAKRSKLGDGDTDMWILSDVARKLWAALEVKPAKPTGGAQKKVEGGEGEREEKMETPIGIAGLESLAFACRFCSGTTFWTRPTCEQVCVECGSPTPLYQAGDWVMPGPNAKMPEWTQAQVIGKPTQYPWPYKRPVEKDAAGNVTKYIDETWAMWWYELSGAAARYPEHELEPYHQVSHPVFGLDED